MRRLLVLALVMSLSAAGCLGGDAGEGKPAPVQANASVTIDENRPDPTFGNVTVGTLAAPDVEATLASPPVLKVGEWWTIEFTDPFTGESVEFVRVVAAVQDGKYVFGMPHEGWYKEAVIFHAPAFGDVNEDLSYNTHDELFTPLKFPLEEGQTWTTSFSGGQQAEASVTVLDEKRAEVTFTTPDGGILGTPAGADGEPNVILRLVYDATMHEVVEFQHPTAVYTVTGHGYDFQGWVTVPRGERLVFFHGRVGPALDFGLQPAAPTETVEVSGGFNRVTFIHASVGFTPGGAYRETAVAPDGTKFETDWTPHPGGFQTTFYEFANPDGMWELTHLAAGPGIAFIEGIAYHQYDVHLPDGAIRSDHSHEVVR